MEVDFDITAEVYTPEHKLIHSGCVKDFSWSDGIIWVEFKDETRYYTGANNIIVKKSKLK